MKGLESGMAIRARLGDGGMPTTVAGRLEWLSELYLGPRIYDDDGHDTGERGAPLISKDQYLKMLDAPELP